MDWSGILAVVGAGLGAGIVITAIGAGSLVSFPILLAVGVNPLVANVSNTVGLVPGGLTGTWGYRGEMAGYPHLVRRVAITSVVPRTSRSTSSQSRTCSTGGASR